jgi:hypothetical protein
LPIEEGMEEKEREEWAKVSKRREGKRRKAHEEHI